MENAVSEGTGGQERESEGEDGVNEGEDEGFDGEDRGFFLLLLKRVVDEEAEMVFQGGSGGLGEELKDGLVNGYGEREREKEEDGEG